MSQPNEVDKLNEQIRQLRQWVNDLQGGMYINCVYCGHRYGPSQTTAATMADALKLHVAKCPAHPMSHLARASLGAWHALQSVIADRTGITDELLRDVSNHLAKQLKEIGRL